MAEATLDQANPDVKYWLGQIEGAQKWHADWHETGKGVVERYLDKKFDANLGNTDALGHKMNMLWSNVQTTSTALYAKTPAPAVQRRFRDRDPVGRWAATVLERCEAYELDAYDDDYNYRQAILDFLLPGRGQVWVYYDPTIEGADDAKRITWECCKVRHIHWKDFLTNPARSWDEVWWVAKREYLTEEEAKAQRLDVAKLTFSDQAEPNQTSDGTDQAQRVRKAAVWEIWSKTHGKVYFVSKNCPELLRDAAPPGLKLQGFFPCPRPITATTSTDSIIPRPDFALYQDQAREIDRLTQRINLLTKALRVAGVYDASQEDLGRLLEDTENNVLIPCTTYAVLASQGGVEGSVSFFPIKDIIGALKQCYESREQAKAAMYEITGISDIVRGATNPDETATAQQLKSQWGGLRIRDRQREVQRFIRDVMRIKAEIHAEQFQSETLRAMSNVPLIDEKTKAQLQQRVQAQQMAQQNPQAAQQLLAQNPQLQALAKPLTQQEQMSLKEPTWEQVMGLLRDDKLRGFSVDVETDSTIQADEVAEKQSRTEFITAITGFMEQWGPMVQAQPKLAPMAGELLLFATRAFNSADSLQTVIEETVETLEQMPPPQQPGQDPATEAKAKAETMNAETNAKKQQSEAANKQLQIKTEAQTDLQTHAMTLQADAMRDGADRQQGAEDAQQDRQAQSQQADATGGKDMQQLAGAINTLAQQQMQMGQQLQSLISALNPAGSA